jgi:hypothetical protein
MSTDRDALDGLRRAFDALDAGPGAPPALLVAAAHDAARRRRRRQVSGAALAAAVAVVCGLGVPGLLSPTGVRPDGDLPVAATTPVRPDTVEPNAPTTPTGPPSVTGLRLGQSVDTPEGTGMCALSPGCPRIVFDVVGTEPGVYDLQCWISRDGRESRFLDATDVVEVMPDGGHVDSTYCAVGPGDGIRVRIVLTGGPSGLVGSEWQAWTGDQP